MTNREFAFTLQNDVYLRYKSFSTADELKKDVVHHNPSRFEIGPVYSARVRLFLSLGRTRELTNAVGTAKGPQDAAQDCFEAATARAGV